MIGVEWWVAGVVVAVAGVVRGLTGFGSGMILMPGLTLCMGPSRAVVVTVLLELLPALHLFPRALPHCHWRSVLPMAAATAVCVPAGAWLLAHLPPAQLKGALGWLLLGGVALMLPSSTRRPLPLSGGLPLAAGAVSGVAGGALGLGGLPAAAYLLRSSLDERSVRAGLIVLLLVGATLSLVAYARLDVIRFESMIHAAALAPVFLLTMMLGAHGFERLPASRFRVLALALIAIPAVALVLP